MHLKEQKRNLWQTLAAAVRASRRRTLSPLDWVIFFVCLAASSVLGVVL